MYYYLSQQSSMVSLILLAVKLLIEINAAQDGAPPGLRRLLDRESWKLPGFGFPKAHSFWLCVAILLVSWVPMVVTFTIPMIAGMLLGVSFPLWSLPLLIFGQALSLSKAKFSDTTSDILVFGASLHAAVWEYISLLWVMVLASLFVRKWLWEVQCWRCSRVTDGDSTPLLMHHDGQKVSALYAGDGTYHPATIVARHDDENWEVEWEQEMPDCTRVARVARSSIRVISGPEPYGPNGYRLGCYTVFFSVPIIFATQSLTVMAIGLYLGVQSAPQLGTSEFAIVLLPSRMALTVTVLGCYKVVFSVPIIRATQSLTVVAIGHDFGVQSAPQLGKSDLAVHTNTAYVECLVSPAVRDCVLPQKLNQNRMRAGV